jgi:hypothetical protein
LYAVELDKSSDEAANAALARAPRGQSAVTVSAFLVGRESDDFKERDEAEAFTSEGMVGQDGGVEGDDMVVPREREMLLCCGGSDLSGIQENEPLEAPVGGIKGRPIR